MSDTVTADIQKLDFQPGDVIMDQGQLAKGLYVLMKGSLEVWFSDMKVADITGRGVYVGEIATLLGGRRIAKVIAGTPVKMLYVERVTDYFVRNPSAALSIAQSLAAKLMEMNSKMHSFKETVDTWIQAGKDAVEKDDVGSIRGTIEDMEQYLLKQMKAG